MLTKTFKGFLNPNVYKHTESQKRSKDRVKGESSLAITLMLEAINSPKDVNFYPADKDTK